MEQVRKNVLHIALPRFEFWDACAAKESVDAAALLRAEIEIYGELFAEEEPGSPRERACTRSTRTASACKELRVGTRWKLISFS